MKIGFVGLGNVGGKLAGSLLRNNFDLTVRDLDENLTSSFKDLGAKIANSAKELAEEVDLIITCLPSPKICAQVMEGEDGILEGLSENKIWLEMSTTDEHEVKRLGKKVISRKLLDTKEQNFYIGIATPNRKEDQKSFIGFVSDFAYWDKALQKNEIQELTETFGLSYVSDTGQYSSSENLKIYYDFKHIQLNQPYQYEEGEIVDMVNPRLSKCYGKVYNAIPKPFNELEQKRISIPARRNSTFEMIEHKPEGYLEGGWKSESTRLNQIRFYNQVINNESNLTQDGLSTLKYTKVSSTSQGKYSFISVKL